jgi:hypothetical protein
MHLELETFKKYRRNAAGIMEYWRNGVMGKMKNQPTAAPIMQ